MTNLPHPRYKRKGRCLQCGWCCEQEDPPCPHLKYSDTGKAICLIYKKANRPMKCRAFPGNPPISHADCGYYFIDKWENNKIVKAGEPLL